MSTGRPASKGGRPEAYDHVAMLRQVLTGQFAEDSPQAVMLERVRSGTRGLLELIGADCPASKGGRPAVYDWSALKATLTKHVEKHGRFKSVDVLVGWCAQKVKRIDGKPKGAGRPDLKTSKAAINRGGLKEIGLSAKA
jgi:hypothetical protein